MTLQYGSFSYWYSPSSHQYYVMAYLLSILDIHTWVLIALQNDLNKQYISMYLKSLYPSSDDDLTWHTWCHLNRICKWTLLKVRYLEMIGKIDLLLRWLSLQVRFHHCMFVFRQFLQRVTKLLVCISSSMMCR